MADQELLEYIRENRGKYSLEKIRQGLLQQGLSYKEVQDAIDFVEKEDSDKISAVLDVVTSEDGDDPIEEEVFYEKPVGKSLKTNIDGYKRTINKTFNFVADNLGLKEKDKRFYIDTAKFGALSFAFVFIISSVFRYIAGKVIYAKAYERFGDYIYINAVPDVFLLKIDQLDFVFSIIWSAILGAVVFILFMKYLVEIWPFNLFDRFNRKLLVFLVGFNIVFGILLNGIFGSFIFIYLLGYIIVLIGVLLSSYLSAEFFTRNMQKRHEAVIRGL